MVNRNRLARWISAALALTLAACDGKARREFKVEELAGKWQLQPESLPSLQSRMGRAPGDSHLILSTDGSFTASEMPLEAIAPDIPFRLRSGKGTWRFEAHSPRNLYVIFPDKDNETLSIEFARDGSLVLVHAVWEPESSERWVWKRAP